VADAHRETTGIAVKLAIDPGQNERCVNVNASTQNSPFAGGNTTHRRTSDTSTILYVITSVTMLSFFIRSYTV
jgi:hypothetical protein